MRKGKKRMIRGFTGLLIVLLGFAIVFYINFKMVQVSGVSMLPTLKNGQRVLVTKAYWLVGPIRARDVVVLTDTGPTGYMIKRVYKMAGEKVDWKYVPDGHKLRDGEYVVPPGTIYVLGDNRNHSDDSRRYGPVAMSAVLGKVWVWQ